MNGVWIGMTPTIVNSRQRIIQLDLCLACSECCEEVHGPMVQDP